MTQGCYSEENIFEKLSLGVLQMLNGLRYTGDAPLEEARRREFTKERDRWQP